MTEFIQNFGLTNIILFLIAAAAAFKGIMDFIDWIKGKSNELYAKKHKEEDLQDKFDKIQQCLDKLTEQEEANAIRHEQVSARLESMQSSITMLIDSDKDQLKSFLTKEHHYFTSRGWIDDYSLDYMEKCFGHQVDEHGNSFVEGLMKEVRELPRRPQS